MTKLFKSCVLLPIIGAVLMAAPTAVFAKRKDPLDRVTPVPAGEPVPTIDYFRPPLFSAPKLNPDGTMFAANVIVGRERQAVLLCDIVSGKLNILDGGTDKDIYEFNWLDGKRIMSRLSVEKRYARGIFISNVRAVDRVDTYPVEFHSVTYTVGIPRANRLHPIVWVARNAYDDGRDGGLLQIDTNRKLIRDGDELPGTRGSTGGDVGAYGMKASVVRSFPSPTGGTPVGYMSDLDGELAYGYTRADGLTTLHRFSEGKWIRTDIDLEQHDIVEIGDKPGELLVLEDGVAGKPRGLQRLDVVSGQRGDILFRNEQYDLDEATIVRQPLTNRIVGVGLEAAMWENVWFDSKYGRIQASVEQQFPKERVRIVGTDDKEKRFFIAAWSDRKPVTYYLADLEKGTFGLIKSSRPWIDPARMRPMSIVRYKTRDGFEIEGYLTLPDGASKTAPVPLVVLPHGGPWVRDTWGWGGETQFLASRGYAVFQPNYRGSDSYSWKFTNEDMWAFRKMHNDVTDGIASIKRTGLIVPDRIAIMGGSFGGYLAVCGAAFEPELYRCAVTIAGVFDWERMIKEVRRIDEGDVRAKRFLRKLGDPEKRKDLFDEISPLRHLDAVKIPIFVAHGTGDQVVDVAQSKRLVSELERLGKPHISHFERGEGHGMAYVDNEVELYTKIEAFLAEHLAARAAP